MALPKEQPSVDPVVDPTPRREGQTTASVVDSPEPSPRLPHERDESSDSQNSQPRRVMKQALSDIESGMVDTDRGPVMDHLYEKDVRTEETAGRGAPEQQPPPPYQSTHPVDAESGAELGREGTAQSDRIGRIEQAAYAAAEKRNFEPGHEVEDWLEAERLVDSLSNDPNTTASGDR